MARRLVAALEFDDLAAGAFDADVGDGVALAFEGDFGVAVGFVFGAGFFAWLRGSGGLENGGGGGDYF